jgi:hypothetical protein
LALGIGANTAVFSIAKARGLAERPAEITCALFEQCRQAIALYLERNVRQILNVLAIWYPYEYEMVRILATGDKASFIEFALHSSEFTEHVEGYGLVRSARTDPRLSIGLVRHHLAQQPRKVADADPKDIEALLAEISRRRNRIEIGLRNLIREGLAFAEGKKAMSVATAALKEDRRAVLSHYAYRDVWQELYFDELISILDKHFGTFQKRLAEDKATVIGWMRHVNRCRSDAHARELGKDDVAYLRVCFARLEEMLDLR